MYSTPPKQAVLQMALQLPSMLVMDKAIATSENVSEIWRHVAVPSITIALLESILSAIEELLDLHPTEWTTVL